MDNCSKYIKNKDCEYFPCHKVKGDYFNCMFCYCPLYALGDKCGGNFVYLEYGIKDCSNCMLPHKEGGYEYIMSKMGDVMKIAKDNRSSEVKKD